jgi:hypothetical protein
MIAHVRLGMVGLLPALTYMALFEAPICPVQYANVVLVL